MSTGEYPKAARLSVELNGVVTQAKYLSNLCEKTEKLEERFKNALVKRIENLEALKVRVQSTRG